LEVVESDRQSAIRILLSEHLHRIINVIRVSIISDILNQLRDLRSDQPPVVVVVILFKQLIPRSSIRPLGWLSHLGATGKLRAARALDNRGSSRASRQSATARLL
jgi:hypothetical protein